MHRKPHDNNKILMTAFHTYSTQVLLVLAQIYQRCNREKQCNFKLNGMIILAFCNSQTNLSACLNFCVTLSHDLDNNVFLSSQNGSERIMTINITQFVSFWWKKYYIVAAQLTNQNAEKPFLTTRIILKTNKWMCLDKSALVCYITAYI
jgi:hypothetical protein